MKVAVSGGESLIGSTRSLRARQAAPRAMRLIYRQYYSAALRDWDRGWSACLACFHRICYCSVRQRRMEKTGRVRGRGGGGRRKRRLEATGSAENDFILACFLTY